MKGRLKLSVMKGEIAMKTRNRQLMWHGMFLFLLGLLTGFVEQVARLPKDLDVAE